MFFEECTHMFLEDGHIWFQNGAEVMSSGVSRFLLLASEDAYVIYSLLKELGMDQWAVASENQALRYTGVALGVAAGWLGAYLRAWIVARYKVLVRYTSFVATFGFRCYYILIVSKDLSDQLCSHINLYKDATPYFRKAVQLYEELAKHMQLRSCLGSFCP
nr:protein transport protein SEC23-like [Tanacetum cinerariifolium]